MANIQFVSDEARSVYEEHGEVLHGALSFETNDTGVGLDLFAVEDVVLKPFQASLVPLGVRVEFPYGTFGALVPRSSLPLKKGVYIPNGFGVIDTGYRGELKGILAPIGQEEVIIHKGEKIFQLVLLDVRYEWFYESSFLNETERGENGFGSSGGYNDE